MAKYDNRYTAEENKAFNKMYAKKWSVLNELLGYSDPRKDNNKQDVNMVAITSINKLKQNNR